MFTTIIPTYGRAHLLPRSIGSALAQTVPDVRVMVFDNASDDDTEQVVRTLAERDPRLEYHRHPVNIGGAANIAFGMNRVTTPYFSILCDDDVLLPNFYATALREFRRWPDATFVGASTLEISEHGEVIFIPASRWSRIGEFTGHDGPASMLGGIHPSLTTVAFSRQLLNTIGVVDPKAGALLDVEYLLRAARAHSYVLTREVAGLFIRHPESWTTNNDQLDRDFNYVIEKNNDSEWIAKRLRAQRNFSLFHRAIAALAQDEPTASRAYASALRRHKARAFTLAAEAAAGLAAKIPLARQLIAWSYGMQFRALGRRSLARSRALHVEGAEDGFRAAIDYYRRLTEEIKGAPTAARRTATWWRRRTKT